LLNSKETRWQGKLIWKEIEKSWGREQRSCRRKLIQHFLNVLNEHRNKERKKICSKMQRQKGKAGKEGTLLHQEIFMEIILGLKK